MAVRSRSLLLLLLLWAVLTSSVLGTNAPSESPSESPTTSPSKSPSKAPTLSPSKSPSKAPTTSPSTSPSKAPTTTSPSESPSEAPTTSPSGSPSTAPTTSPSESPSTAPTTAPTISPSETPSQSPSQGPTSSPTSSPTIAPTPTPRSILASTSTMDILEGGSMRSYTLTNAYDQLGPEEELCTDIVVLNINPLDRGITITPDTYCFSSFGEQVNINVQVDRDNIDIASNEQFELNHTGLDIETSIDITIHDMDEASTTLSKVSCQVTQEGAGDSYEVNLETKPTSTVTVTIVDQFSTGLVDISPSVLTFDDSDYNVPQLVTLSSTSGTPASQASFSLVSLLHTVASSDSQYNGGLVQPSDTVNVKWFTSVKPTIILTAESLEAVEGVSGITNYKVRLDTEPSSGDQVVIDITSSVNGYGGTLQITPNQLTFTNADWTTEQEVDVFYEQDNAFLSSTLDFTITHTLNGATTDSFYAANAEYWPGDQIQVTVSDTSQPQILLSEQSGYVTEGGSGTVYYITLTVIPTASVIVDISNPSPTLITVTPSQVTLTPADWNQTHVVTVEAVSSTSSEEANDFLKSLTILTHAATSADPAYDGGDAHFTPTNIYLVRRLENPEDPPCPAGTYNEGLECKPCTAGFMCPEVESDPLPCPLGTFALAGQSNCTLCPAGYSCPSSQSNAMELCEEGSYSEMGSSSCTTCPVGMMCPSISQAIEQDCIAGTYSIGGQENCTICPAGKRCPDVTGLSISDCDPGTYSLPGSDSCTSCPAGYACPFNDRAPEPSDACDPGTYTLAVGGAITCSVCPSGYKCPLQDQEVLIPCESGTFSLGSNSTCAECPAGFRCDSTLGPVASCSAGYYSLQGSENCLECPVGHYCPDPGANPRSCPAGAFQSLGGATSCEDCDAGYFCPVNGTATPDICPEGYYSQQGALECTACDPGYWCSEGATSPTPEVDICPEGGYCKPPTVPFTLCPAGTYGAMAGGQSAEHACVVCPDGRYCPEGSTSSTHQACPPGYYCPEGTTYSTEYPCPSGTFNPHDSQASLSACNETQAGYYSPQGSNWYYPCPSGYYCPLATGDYQMFPCPSGTYSGPRTGLIEASECLQCEAGSYCPSASVTPTLCDEGTYNPNPGAGMSINCLPCEPGYACTMKGQIASTNTTCEPGYYCPLGTANPYANPCPEGTYTDSQYSGDLEDCVPCEPGTACDLGTGGTNKLPQSCAAGHYCPRGTRYPTEFDCPRGTYSGATNLIAPENCTICPVGRYCEGGLSYIGGSFDVLGECAQGHYCPEKTYQPNQFPCPAGTYTSSTSLAAVEECTPCDPGHYCLEGSSEPSLCPEGSYSAVTGETSPLCQTCPEGSECEEGTINPIPCSPGYQSASGQFPCQACEAGYHCEHNATTYVQMLSQPCEAGLYCPSGVAVQPSFAQHPCPKAFYCPEGIDLPIECPVGTFNSQEGRGSLDDCQDCTEGYYCVAQSYQVTGICDAGYYCPPGSTGPQQFPCPARTYRNSSGGIAEESCSVCPAGYYCPLATIDPIDCPKGYYCNIGVDNPEPCPLGRYGNTTNLRRAEECSPCIAGSFCDGLGDTGPKGLCDPGYYCLTGSYSQAPGSPGSNWTHAIRDEAEAALLFDDIGGICPGGHYCPQGSSEPTACPPGTFNNITGASTHDACISCRPGYYCSGYGNEFPTGPCDPGYFCPGGSETPTDEITPPGFYSEEGAVAATPCEHGYFNSDWAKGECTPCLEGFYCGNSSTVNPEICPQGSYCVIQSITPQKCPAGTFSASVQLTEESQCTPCTAGSYCASNGLVQPTGSCAAGHFCLTGSTISVPQNIPEGDVCWEGHYCVEGSTYPEPCPRGTYNPNSKSTGLLDCIPCDEGHYCSERGLTAPTAICEPGYYCNVSSIEPIPCEPGTYSNVTGAFAHDVCEDCPPGHYCSGYGNAKPTGLCEEGYYCEGRATQPRENVVSPGFFAPLGSDFPSACAPGTFTDEPASGSCLSCPDGFYCSNYSVTEPLVCPEGYYCDEGSITPEPCPQGTFSDMTQLSNVSSCQQCVAGMYCDQNGLQEPTGYCDAGHFCAEGATLPNPRGNETEGGNHGICWAGHYCEPGSSWPEPCPIGTYNPAQESKSVDDCLPCDPGSFCNQTGLIRPSGPCAAGYFCSGSAFSATPPLNGSDTGGICPQGYNCPEGTAIPTPCSPGTFASSEGVTGCESCPAGFYCDGITTDATLPCPIGSYCPPGTGANPPKCPPGTFGTRERLESVDECQICPAGSYCSSYGLTNVTGPCIEGYVCDPGSKTEFGGGVQCIDDDLLPNDCPRGHFCLYGQAFPCPLGTFNDQLGGNSSDDCRPCEPGHWCHREAIAYQEDYLCPTGHYCESSTSLPIPCPVGSYRDDPGAASVEECYDCIPGHFCPGDEILAPRNDTNQYWTANSGSSFPIPCPIGTYCVGLNTIPVLCPLGYKGRQDVQDGDRSSIGMACELCPAGYHGSDPFRLECEMCSEGHICLQGATTSVPEDLASESGYICPAGFYCPSGVTNELPCPRGTHNNATGASELEDCLVCASKTYNDLIAQQGCKPCASSSVSEEGSWKCECLGRNRAFEPSSGKCLCIPGFESFDQSSGFSIKLPDDEDGVEDCQPITYKRCEIGQVLDSDGSCVTEEESCAQKCSYLGNGGKLSFALGVCDCNGAPLLDQICDGPCRNLAVSAHMSPSAASNQSLVLSDGQQLNLAETQGFHGSVSCSPEDSCNVIPCTLKQLAQAGAASCHYDARRGLEGLVHGANETVHTRRRRLAGTNETVDVVLTGQVQQPVVCIQSGDTVMFNLEEGQGEGEESSSEVTRNYPVYKKDSLLNTNNDFDYASFRFLKEADFVSMFGFTFVEPGIYVFGTSLNLDDEIVISVQSRGQQCPTDAPIIPRTTSALLALGAQRNNDLIMEPDWTLIGALFGGILGLIVITMLVLFVFREFALGSVVIVPKYRNKNRLDAKPKRSGTGIRGGIFSRWRNRNKVGVVGEGTNRGIPDTLGTGATLGYDRWGEEDLDARQVVERLVHNHAEVKNGLENQDERIETQFENLRETLKQETEDLKMMLDAIHEKQEKIPELDPGMIAKLAAARNDIDWNNAAAADESMPLDALQAKESELLEKKWEEEENEQLVQLQNALERQDSQELLEQQIKADEELDNLEKMLAERDDMTEEERERILEEFQQDQEMLRETLDIEKRRQQEDLKNRLAERKLRNRRSVSRRHNRAKNAEAALNGQSTTSEEDRPSQIIAETQVIAAQEEAEMIEMDLNMEVEKMVESTQQVNAVKEETAQVLEKADIEKVNSALVAEREAAEKAFEEESEIKKTELLQRLKQEAEERLEDAVALDALESEPAEDEIDLVGIAVKEVLGKVNEEEINEKVNIESEIAATEKMEQESLRENLNKMLEDAKNQPQAKELISNLRKEHEEKQKQLQDSLSKQRKAKYDQLMARIAEKKKKKIKEVVDKVKDEKGEEVDEAELVEEVEQIVTANIEESNLRVNVELEERRKEDIARQLEIEKREAQLARREAELLVEAAAFKKGQDAQDEVQKLRESHQNHLSKLEQSQAEKRNAQRAALQKRAEERKRKLLEQKAKKQRELEAVNERDEDAEILDHTADQLADDLKRRTSSASEEEQLSEEHRRKIEDIKMRQIEERERLELEMEEAKQRLVQKRIEEEEKEAKRIEELRKKEEEELVKSAATQEELASIKEQHAREMEHKIQKANEEKARQREKLLQRLEAKKARKKKLLEAKQKHEIGKTIEQTKQETASVTSGATNATDYLREEAIAIAALFQQHRGAASVPDAYRAIERIVEPRHTREKMSLSEKQYQERMSKIKETFSAINTEKHGKKMKLIATKADMSELAALETEYKNKIRTAETVCVMEIEKNHRAEEQRLLKKQADEISDYVSKYSKGPREVLKKDEEKELKELKELVSNERKVRLAEIRSEHQEEEQRAQDKYDRAVLDIEKSLQLDSKGLRAKAEERFLQHQNRLLKDQESLQRKKLESLGPIDGATHAATLEEFALDRERLTSALRAEQARQQDKTDARIARLKNRALRYHRQRLELRLKDVQVLTAKKEFILEDSLRRMFEQRSSKMDRIIVSSSSPLAGNLSSPPSSPVQRVADELFGNFELGASAEPKSLQEMQKFRRSASLKRIQSLNRFSITGGAASLSDNPNGSSSDASSGNPSSSSSTADANLAARLANIEGLLSNLAGGTGRQKSSRRLLFKKANSKSTDLGREDGAAPKYMDPLDSTLDPGLDSKLVTIEDGDLTSTERIRLSFGRKVASMIKSNIQLAMCRSVPSNGHSNTAFRNSFHWDGNTLFLRLERLQSIGDFTLVLVHCLSHIKTAVSDSFDDSDPTFIREFHSNLRQVNGLLFNHSSHAGGELKEEGEEASLEADVGKSKASSLPARVGAYAAFAKGSAVNSLLSRLGVDFEDDDDDDGEDDFGEGSDKSTSLIPELDRDNSTSTVEDVAKKYGEKKAKVAGLLEESNSRLEEIKEKILDLNEKLEKLSESGEEHDKLSQELELSVASREQELRRIEKLKAELKEREGRHTKFLQKSASLKGTITEGLLEEIDEGEEG